MPEFNLSEVVIEPLAKQHNRKAFDCGRADLNAFVRQYAMQQQKQGYYQGLGGLTIDQWRQIEVK